MWIFIYIYIHGIPFHFSSCRSNTCRSNSFNCTTSTAASASTCAYTCDHKNTTTLTPHCHYITIDTTVSLHYYYTTTTFTYALPWLLFTILIIISITTTLHTYLHTYIHTYIHTHIHTYIKERKLKPANLLKQKAFLHVRPNMVKTCFACRSYIVKPHSWENQQHACYYEGTPMRHRITACFQALVLDPHFAHTLRPLLVTYFLGWQKFTACIYLNDAKCESAGLSKTCGLQMILSVGWRIISPLSMQSPKNAVFKQWSPLLEQTVQTCLVFHLQSKVWTTLDKVSVGTSWKS